MFIAPSYTFEVEENAPEGTMVGRVHAKDTDSANNPVRWEGKQVYQVYQKEEFE